MRNIESILQPLRGSFRDLGNSAAVTAERAADAAHDRMVDVLGKSERQLEVLRRHALDAAHDAVRDAKTSLQPYRQRIQRVYADAIAKAPSGGEILRNRYVLLSLAAGTCYLVVRQLRKRRQKPKAISKPRTAARAANGQRKPRVAARANAET